MRMIDADALVASLKKKYCADCPALFGCDCSFDDDLRDINGAPTIDAIPVKEFCEWLEERGSNIFKVAFTINVQLFRAAMEKGEKNERD